MLIFLLTVVVLSGRELLIGLTVRDVKYKPNPPTLKMQFAISLVFTVAGLWMILSHHYDPQEKHWAYTTLGTILGFWIRGLPK